MSEDLSETAPGLCVFYQPCQQHAGPDRTWKKLQRFFSQQLAGSEKPWLLRIVEPLKKIFVFWEIIWTFHFGKIIVHLSCDHGFFDAGILSNYHVLQTANCITRCAMNQCALWFSNGCPFVSQQRIHSCLRTNMPNCSMSPAFWPDGNGGIGRCNIQKPPFDSAGKLTLDQALKQ